LDRWLALALVALYASDFKPVKARSVDTGTGDRLMTSNSGKGDCSLARCGSCTFDGTASNAAGSDARWTVGNGQPPGVSGITC